MSTVDDWVVRLKADLGVDLPVDVRGLLELARAAAHSVDRPAAPLTTFLVGYAAAQAGGGVEAVDAAARRAGQLAADWAAGRTSDNG